MGIGCTSGCGDSMSRQCKCGGKFKRTDLYVDKQGFTCDKSTQTATFDCTGCKRTVVQRKRQAKKINT